MRLILASASPRRRDLLSRLSIPFQVVPSQLLEPEPEEGKDPGEYALELAGRKAQDVGRKHPNAVILAGDTVVALNGEIFGKPHSSEEAEAVLQKLSGAQHSVITALVVLCRDATHDGTLESRVLMRAMLDEEIRGYVATGESLDKAGGYAVQGLGAGLVAEVVGCYYNVVGLPLCLTADLLRKCGVRSGEKATSLCVHSPSARP